MNALAIRHHWLSCVAGFAVCATAVADEPAGAARSAPGEADKAAEAFFNESVLPILKKSCYECHSHAAGKAKGGLVLDSRSGWATGGDNGPAIVPGKPVESLLMQAVRYTDLQMPPKGKLP